MCKYYVIPGKVADLLARIYNGEDYHEELEELFANMIYGGHPSDVPEEWSIYSRLGTIHYYVDGMLINCRTHERMPAEKAPKFMNCFLNFPNRKLRDKYVEKYLREHKTFEELTKREKDMLRPGWQE